MTAVDTSRAAEAERTAATPRIVRPGEGNRVRAFGNEIEFMLSGEQTGESLTVGLASVPVGNGPPPHVHYSEDELFLILEGEYRIYLNGDWTTVGPGTVVYLPRGSVHTFQVAGDKPGGERQSGRAGDGQWVGDSGGGEEQHLRPVLHDEAGGEGNRARPRHR